MSNQNQNSQNPRPGQGGPNRGGPGGPGGPNRGGPNRGGPNRGGPGRGGPGRKRNFNQVEEEQEAPEFTEKVVHINRCAKVVKGGRRFSFSALVVVGNQKGEVGIGYGKAKEVPECIRKGTEAAKKNLVKINLRGETIPHEVFGESDGGKVLLRPATDGTGVIAGGGVRAVLEAVGVNNVLSKSLGSNNHLAMVNATMAALQQLRSHEEIKKLRFGDKVAVEA